VPSGSEESGAFINGILDKIAGELGVRGPTGAGTATEAGPGVKK
jgi:hypothetical protein